MTDTVGRSSDRRKTLLQRLKAILLDEVDEIVVRMFSTEKEYPYWQHSSDIRLQDEFRATVSNMWLLLSCVALKREVTNLVAFECGKALVQLETCHIRLVTKLWQHKPEIQWVLIFLQNYMFFTKKYNRILPHVIERFLFKLHDTELFDNTRLDRYCENWEPRNHQQLKFFLNSQRVKRAVHWLCDEEETSKKYISEQMNSRANTLLKDQLKTRLRADFLQSNHHEDACCFEDLFYILKLINDSPLAHLVNYSLSKEELVHGNETMEASCRKALKAILAKKPEIVHAYILKNDVKEGVMGHWTVLCYQRMNERNQWRLTEYFNPSGNGFRCGDRCVKWILTHTEQRGYVTMPEEILEKLRAHGTEREIVWDMTEMTKQISECVEVQIPTYIMNEEDDLVNLLPVNTSSGEEEEESSESWEEDNDWEYVPSVQEVLMTSFTEDEIKYLMKKHGIDHRNVTIAEAIEKMCVFQ